jgi:ppGpp synthetase/RelA/SpoT-type nucleotidyltranferase
VETSPPRKKQMLMGWAREKTRLPGAEKLADPAKAKKYKERVTEYIIGTGRVQSLIREGKLKGSLDEHQKLAAQAREKHDAELKSTLQELQALAPQGATVMGRVKTEGSMIGKVARKPKYGTPDKLQDVTGTTIVVDSLAATQGVLDGIKGKYKVVAYDDYVTKPQSGHYRAQHLVIETPSGLQKEVQIKTRRQLAYSKWSHDPYKPQNAEQMAAVKQHAAVIDAYAKAMSDHIYELDQGRQPSSPPPPCPEVVRKAFGCVGI